MRALRLEDKEPEVYSSLWWSRKFPVRSKVEITVEDWPRRQRFGRITAVIPKLFSSGKYESAYVKVALPRRFEMTQAAWRNYFIALSAIEYGQAYELDDIDMAFIQDDEDLWDYGIEFHHTEIEVVGPPLPRERIETRAVRIA